MRPYHILLAVRIIILYQLFLLLFCVHRGLLFFLVLLFAISETSLTYSIDSYFFPSSPHLVSSYSFLSCWWCFEFTRRLVLSYISTLPLPLRLFAPQIRPIHMFRNVGWRVRYKRLFLSPSSIPLIGISPHPCLFLPRTGMDFRIPFSRRALSDPHLDPFSRPSPHLSKCSPPPRSPYIAQYTYTHPPFTVTYVWLQRLLPHTAPILRLVALPVVSTGCTSVA